jgi:hypothetical protein
MSPEEDEREVLRVVERRPRRPPLWLLSLRLLADDAGAGPLPLPLEERRLEELARRPDEEDEGLVALPLLLPCPVKLSVKAGAAPAAPSSITLTSSSAPCRGGQQHKGQLILLWNSMMSYHEHTHKHYDG